MKFFVANVALKALCWILEKNAAKNEKENKYPNIILSSVLECKL